MNTIRRYGNPAEAGFARSLLEAAGIEAVLADEFAATLGPQFVPWGMRLQVREEDVERALEILDGPGGLGGQEAADVDQDATTPMEHEAPSRSREEGETPDVTCPKCGEEWALTEQELAQPSFTCADCGMEIPRSEVEAPVDRTRKFDWSGFVPRSESKWVFVLVMVAYNLLLQGILTQVMGPFVGEWPKPPVAHGWSGIAFYSTEFILYAPIWQTLALIAIIELFRANRRPTIVQILIPAILVCSTDGIHWWPHAVYSFPGFVIFAVAYLYWRPESRWTAAFVAIAIHSTFNAACDIHLVLGAIKSEREALRLTGDASSWERADAIFYRSQRFQSEESSDEEIKSLQSAIDTYPYDPRYYLSLGLAFEGAHRLTEAETAFQKVIALDDRKYVWQAWDDLVFIFKDEKRFREALDAAHEALLGAPEDKRTEIEDQIAAIAPSANGTSQ